MTKPGKRLTLRVPGAIALLLIVAVTAGCSTLQSQFEQPTVKLANISMLEASLSQQVYGLTLQVDNPNGFALPVRLVNYRVQLGQQDFASGATRNAFSIPANGSDSIDLEVRTNLIESFNQLAQLLRGGARDLDYQISGDIQINLPLIKAVPFSQSGTIPLTVETRTQ